MRLACGQAFRTGRYHREAQGRKSNTLGPTDEQYPKSGYGNCEQGADTGMKHPKYYLYFTGDEYRLMLDALIQRKNKLHRIGKYTDPVDEVIIKLGKAKYKRIQI